MGKGGSVCFILPGTRLLLSCTSYLDHSQLSELNTLGNEDTVDFHGQADATDNKDVNLLTPPEMHMEPNNYQMSNLQLIFLGAAFFASWAGSVRPPMPCISGSPLTYSRRRYHRPQLSYLSFRRNSGFRRARFNGLRHLVPLSG